MATWSLHLVHLGAKFSPLSPPVSPPFSRGGLRSSSLEVLGNTILTILSIFNNVHLVHLVHLIPMNPHAYMEKQITEGVAISNQVFAIFISLCIWAVSRFKGGLGGLG
jgi:hypothetical protein